ncbi:MULTISPECIES: chloride channel protein [Thioclava]|uniref:Chloride channel protein n=1 Tax=Thioclava electrotropha TaxID=1549850 RepID=A0ABX6YZW5_9RHOB|nr:MULTISPECIES: chloride channel protein [Thioclava]MPQ96128.1 chloride channel protein [Thioclava sp. JE_KL1]QPZ93429.1 chloride channel protein [Thioclava electrotropha]
MADRLRLFRRRSVLRRLFAPFRLRTLIRRNEIAYTALAAIVGLFSGLAVVGMQELIQLMGLWIFGSETPVSGADTLAPLRRLAGPVIGGVLVGLSYLIGRRWFRRVADPIEANAVGGGKLSILGSLYISAQTVLSSGFGGSVGMEAAYTQVASGGSSWLGQRLRLRREELRQLVAAGAGGAIAAAFDAPLAGAFYAFELVLATYNVAALLPVLAASIAATSITRLISNSHGPNLFFAGEIPVEGYLPIALLAVLSAGVGIVIMRSVAMMEHVFGKSPIPGWGQPIIGGLVVGVLALTSPQVLSSGHGAMTLVLGTNMTVWALLALFGLKIVASIVSLGSGFRGGLFFASLLLGAILGKVFAIGWMLAFGLQVPIVVFAVVGMCALATSIIGAPMAMSFLALEMTQSLPLALAVLFSALLSTSIVRQFFGFSFSTWRFHLRGETIRSATDVGWIRDLSVGRLMRRSPNTMPTTATIAEARRRFPLGSTKTVPLLDQTDSYAGMCQMTDLHSDGQDPKERVASIARHKSAWLRPEQTVRDAIDAFARNEADTLAVVSNDMQVLGTLNEHYCLRRYADETNKRLYPARH